MTDKAISPLRRRMIEDMTVHGFTPSTQRGYIRAVKDFTAFLGRSPDQARAQGKDIVLLSVAAKRGAHFRHALRRAD